MLAYPRENRISCLERQSVLGEDERWVNTAPSLQLNSCPLPAGFGCKIRPFFYSALTLSNAKLSTAIYPVATIGEQDPELGSPAPAPELLCWGFVQINHS